MPGSHDIEQTRLKSRTQSHISVGYLMVSIYHGCRSNQLREKVSDNRWRPIIIVLLIDLLLYLLYDWPRPGSRLLSVRNDP